MSFHTVYVMTFLAFKVETPSFQLWDEFYHLLTTKKLGRLTRFYSMDKEGSYYFYICVGNLTEEGASLLQQLHEWKHAYRMYPDKPTEVGLLQPCWVTEHRQWDIEYALVQPG